MVVQYIKELLQETDEVIVQDLGTFQGAYSSAEIHPATHAFTPPSKAISFNGKLKISNLQLENKIVKDTEKTVDEAKEIIQNFVSTLKMNLGIEKRVNLEDLGEMILQLDNEIEFKQNKELNLLSGSFGLPEIYAKPVERSQEKKSNIPNQQNIKNTNHKPPTENTQKSSWGTIAAISSLAFVVLAVIYVVAIDSSLNPFKSLLGINNKNNENKKELETKENDSTANQVNNNTDTTQKEDSKQSNSQTDTTTAKKEEVKPEENTPKEEIKPEEKPKEEEKPKGDGILVSEKAGKFFIVIGGFASQNNAYKKVREVKNEGVSNVMVIPPFDNRNLYRVGVGAFTSKQEAEASLEDIKSKYGADVWVLRY
ncbi:MAG: SPOR domain-containing protein [Thermonemataceae bacterium]|nr:SPOR domain-containing protein [Thermonemataceae bacterium]